MATPPHGHQHAVLPLEPVTKRLSSKYTTPTEDEEKEDSEETTGLLSGSEIMSDRRLFDDSQSTMNTEEHSKVVEMAVFLRDRNGIFFALEEGHLAQAEELLEMVLEEQSLPSESKEIFSLWLVSSVMDIRLKKTHQPYRIVQQWDSLCALYTDAKLEEIQRSEPVLMVQRDVFFPLEKEKNITNEEILCLLYHEAKFNVIEGRYPLHMEDYHQLAGIQAVIHLGKYDSKQHVLADYRANLIKFYPEHMYQKHRFLFFTKKSDGAECESFFMEAHKRISEEYANVSVSKSLSRLYRQYLEICWSYSFYGSAFFSGQVETPAGRIKKLLKAPADTQVLVAINTECVSIIDKEKVDLILAVPYTQLSWEFKEPEFNVDSEPLPCLYLQFLHEDSNPKNRDITKLLQVYSREGKLMDALINSCVKRKLHERYVTSPGIDYVDSGIFENSRSKVTSKLEKLCLSTYTKQGEAVD